MTAKTKKSGWIQYLRAVSSLRVATNGCLAALLTGTILTQSVAGAVDPLVASGGEFKPAFSGIGDQGRSDAALGSTGGFVVWQDNATDEDGLGISARRLNSVNSGALTTFRVNSQGLGNQERPKVAMLPDGSAVVAWQGGAAGAQQVYGRIISSKGLFVGSDFLISSDARHTHSDVSLAVMANGSFVASYTSTGQDGSMDGVYAQVFTSGGEKIGSEVKVSITSDLNQRSSTLVSLTDNRFVVAWISEGQNDADSVDLYARIFDAAGNGLGGEQLINDGTDIASSPSIGIIGQSTLVAVWNRLSLADGKADWNVASRSFRLEGNTLKPNGSARVVNTTLTRNQLNPRLAVLHNSALVVWTSDWQDGSQEGVYGRALDSLGAPIGSEFRVNTTTASRQIEPVVISDGNHSFVTLWTSFVGVETGMDLMGQIYSLESAADLVQPPVPVASAVSADSVSVAWPELLGVSLTSYLVAVDGGIPVQVPSNQLYTTVKNPAWEAGSAHTVSLSYKTSTGFVSASSAPVSFSLWGGDSNNDGLPDDWQKANYAGAWASKLVGPLADTDGDGASNLQEFLAGTNPNDSESCLRLFLTTTPVSSVLTWNTQPGFVYQVQYTTDLKVWADMGAPRFAAGSTDSASTSGSTDIRYYRVIRLR